MNPDFNFFKTAMPKTRQADYYLGCLDSCVFLDFNRSNDNLISLARISFDGYGCCSLDDKAKSLNSEESSMFISEMKSEHMNQEVITKLVKSLIRINKEHIWTDALEEYALIEKGEDKETSMEKSQKKNPEFLDYVYQLNEGIELNKALQLNLKEIDKIDIAQLNRIGHKTYEKGKWTIHTMLQHLIDWERIWCFRAIILARGEGTIPEAHDQEIMAENSNANERSIEELINELRVVRQSTILLFESFDQKTLETNCVFFEYEMPLDAIGLTITAHQIHHLNVIQERYLPLDS